MIRIAITKPDFFEGEADKIVSLLGLLSTHQKAAIPTDEMGRNAVYERKDMVEDFPMKPFVSKSSEALADKTVGKFDRIHIRKPDASREEIAALLSAIPSELHPRLVLHDHFELIEDFPRIGGFHLNRRNPSVSFLLKDDKFVEIFKGEDRTASSGESLGIKGKTLSRSCHSLDEVAKYKQECDYVFLSPIFDSISKVGYSSAFTSDILQQANKDGIIDGKVYALGGISIDKIGLLQEWGFGGYAMLGAAWRD